VWLAFNWVLSEEGVVPTGIRNSVPIAVILVFAFSSLASAQIDSTPKKRLRSPAVVKGFIGGESHDSYVILGTKGKTMTVQIRWRKVGNNRASFTIKESPIFFETESVEFGNTSDDGKRWTGKIPKSADYYIYVVAYPTAHYTLTVTINSVTK